MEALNSDSRDELLDAESGMPHVDHMLFNVISLRLALERECGLLRDPGLPKTFESVKKQIDTSNGGC
jgi:hypothetical protein